MAVAHHHTALALLAWLAGSIGWAQPTPTRPALHPQVMAEAQRLVRFDSLARHLPPLTEADTTAHTLSFRMSNTSREPLRIVKAMATCGCTTVTHCPTRPLPPGGTDSIVVQYKTDRGPGTIDEPVYVYASRDASHPIATLHVLGRVRETEATRWRHLPEVMGPLRLRRKELTFGPSDVVMRIPCANTSPAPLTVKAALVPPYATLRTEPQTIAPQAEADIVVRIDRSKLPTHQPTRAAIILDGIPCSMEQRRIELTIHQP